MQPELGVVTLICWLCANPPLKAQALINGLEYFFFQRISSRLDNLKGPLHKDNYRTMEAENVGDLRDI